MPDEPGVPPLPLLFVFYVSVLAMSAAASAAFTHLLSDGTKTSSLQLQAHCAPESAMPGASHDQHALAPCWGQSSPVAPVPTVMGEKSQVPFTSNSV